ncbi:MAG: adenylosuccinate synthase [Phycisphaerae bacterium]|nr:adenylosuccinate synthase [Phycisphaerae bacterium]
MPQRPPGHCCVFGLGWGDEGKGKITDLLCPHFDVAVRYNGGANAGHTVFVGREKFALHLLPTGALHEDMEIVIGPGVVVDPIKLIEEIDGLVGRGMDVRSRLRISDRAHLVLDYHKLEDQLGESSAGEGTKIGTTARGIGPCYADKARRSTAVRFGDLLHDAGLEDRVGRVIEQRKRVFTTLYGSDGGLEANAVVAALSLARKRLGENIGDTTAELHAALEQNKLILFEGANGVLLDVDHGTYPFVTSSSTGPHGIGSGAGVPDGLVTSRIGVCKAYATRVGSGPFVTELHDAVGERIRRQGNEFGTTTGRPRRCGWFDAVACKYAVQLSGATDLAVMHLDTLSGFEQIGVCAGYDHAGERLGTFPANTQRLEHCRPILDIMPGWSDSLRDVTKFDDLPRAALDYLARLEELVGAPVNLVGVGPERSQTLVRGELSKWIQIPPPPPASLP